MTRLEVVLRPHKLDEVKEALVRIGLTGLTVVEVKGHGRQRGHPEIYRGEEYTIDLVPKVKLEVVVPTPFVPRAVEAITRAARDGRIGSGKIFAVPVDEAVRLRTGERGEQAL